MTQILGSREILLTSAVDITKLSNFYEVLHNKRLFEEKLIIFVSLEIYALSSSDKSIHNANNIYFYHSLFTYFCQKIKVSYHKN